MRWVPRSLAWVRQTLGGFPVEMALVGLLIGVSVGTLSRDVVLIPVLGPVPGIAAGSVGLLAGVGAYGLLRRRSSCGRGEDCDC